VGEDGVEPGALTRGPQCLGSPAPVCGGWADLGRSVKSVAASGVASFAIDSEGELWAWGYSKRGQLGLGREIIGTDIPMVNPILGF
jgi:hypothetical protein